MDTYPASKHILTKSEVKGTTLHEWVTGRTCPKCGAKLPALGAGKTVRCRRCKRNVRLSEDATQLEVGRE